MLLSELAPLVEAHQGVIYQMDDGRRAPICERLAGYANRAGSGQGSPSVFVLGEGLVGQCAADRSASC
jgi:hypothetical protein